MLKIDIEYKDNILYVRLKGILNRQGSYKINNYVNPIIKKHNIKYLVYNWFDLEDIDSAGLSAIENSKYLIRCNKGKIRICLDKKKLIGICKVLKIPIINCENDALEMI